MKWFKKSLIRQVGTIVIGFLILAFVFYGIVSISLMSDFFEQHSKTELSTDALFIANEIDKYMEKNIVVVTQMKTNQDFQAIAETLNTREEKKVHPLYQVVTQELQAIKSSEPNISLAYIVIAKSNDVISSTPDFDPAPEYKLSNRSWYNETIRSDRVTVTSPYIDVVTGKPVVTIATPIYKNTEIIGALAIDVQVSDISKLMDSYKIGEHGYTFLINKDGSIFYQPQDINIYINEGSNPFDYINTYLSQITAGQSGIIDHQSGPNAKYIAYVPTRSTHWIVTTVIPKSDVLAPLNHFLLNLIIISAALMLLVILFIRQMTRLVSDPIITITESVSQFTKGNSEITLPDSFYAREDELGILSTGLGQMSHQINAYIMEIEENNRTLNREINRRQKIQERMEMILKLLSSSDEGIFILDQNFHSLFHNIAFSKIIGIPESEIPLINLLEEQILITEEIIKDLDLNPSWTGEIEYATGNTHFLFMRINKVVSQTQTYYIGNLSDLTAFKQIEKDFNYLKYFDHLTRLNSKLFMDEAGSALINEDRSSDNRHALILINIDNFRIINEAKGFDFGNNVLIAMASRLKRLVNDQDLLARLGNDEFGMLKKNIQSNEDLYDYMINLTTQLDDYFHINDEQLSIDVSMGISLYPSDADQYSSLLEKATSALNNVKSQKGIRFEFYDSIINHHSVQKYEIQNKLRSALNNNEFVLYYQPQVDANTNQIVGLEALLRWMSPEGMIPPDQFISIAEDSNLIIPIGEWIIKEACEFAKRLEHFGYKTPVAVNLSSLQFKEPYIINLVDTNLAQTQLSPDLLELEITEGILLANEVECENILSAFDQMGLQVSIDDFGTGYSSLNYLKQFEVDKIKIDRSFIKDIPDNDNGAIARIIIELADNFNLQVIAEGVETQEQIDFLKQNNCHIIQGFFFAQPMPEIELLEWIKSFNN